METQRLVVPEAEEILGKYFPVLDYGFISLIDYMGGDNSIEQAARISYGTGTRKNLETRGLIRYLRRHRHTTPTEMVELKFHIAMPIFIFRQWIRHRTASVNEISGRYSIIPDVFYTPDKENFREQAAGNKQGRDKITSEDLYNRVKYILEENRKRDINLYDFMLDNNVARELARIDLPLSTYTQVYWKIDLHNLFHFLGLRVDSHAQWEIQQYAKTMAGMVKRVAPLSFEAWVDYELCGSHMSRMELDVLRNLIGQNDDATELLTDDDHITCNKMKLDYGLTQREVGELFSKFKPQEIPNFDLDLSLAKDSDYFKSIYNKPTKEITKEIKNK